MNNFWSKKVQSTELLYYSRAERFNAENAGAWFSLLKVKNGMKVLEVGCGGGLFTNMIKKYYPDCEVYGIDLDENHIKFAKNRCRELNLAVNYAVADIKALPFPDNYFDLVFSHTVVEHLPFADFILEQKRVLKTGGDLIIMRVDMKKGNDRPFAFLENEIREVYNSLEIEKQSPAKYLEEPDATMQHLLEFGFKDIDLDFLRIIYYMPDVQPNRKIALDQIERNYKSKLHDALFNLGRAENQEKYKNKLLKLIKNQYEKRKEIYMSNQKIFDFESTSLITITAQK